MMNLQKYESNFQHHQKGRSTETIGSRSKGVCPVTGTGAKKAKKLYVRVRSVFVPQKRTAVGGMLDRKPQRPRDEFEL